MSEQAQDRELPPGWKIVQADEHDDANDLGDLHWDLAFFVLDDEKRMHVLWRDKMPLRFAPCDLDRQTEVQACK